MQMVQARTRAAADGYLQAFAARDVAGALEFFADDAEMIEPPGRFAGKDAIRTLLEWDVRLSPVANASPSGVGVLTHEGIVVEEEVVEQTFEGRRYSYPLVRVFEINDDGRIQRLRVYFDRLSMLQRIATQTPGIQGRLFKALINYVVGQSEKGLSATTAPDSQRQT